VFCSEARQALEQCDPFERYRGCYHRFADLDPVQQMLWTDAQIILPDVYFEKVDKATMAHGIEVRVPMVDLPLARYVMSLPSAYKVRPNRLKHLLRQSLRGTVPDDILDGPKTGFGVPFQHWLAGPLAGYLREVLLDPAVLRTGLIDPQPLQRVIQEHTAGKADHGFLLNKLLQLGHWIQMYLEPTQPTDLTDLQPGLTKVKST
jgi:asparagine synthase (glutamine-hydrolysing)